MFRRAWLLFLLALIFIISAPLATVFAAPAKTLSVEAYRAQLQKATTQLERLEERPPRQLAPVLAPLQQDATIKRADGQTQEASGDEWSSIAKKVPVSASRETTRQLREKIIARQRALDSWASSSYTPADAQSIMRQLEGSGQIRTGPTWLQQTWSNFYKLVTQTWKRFLTWIGSLFPTATPGQMPQIDPAWIKAVFTLTVIALLALVAFLVWRAVGGHIGKKRKKQGAFAFSPEDLELLALPPDELRERAHRFAGEGNFREALRHLYIALLLSLDTRGVWRYDARRTNWEHITALRADAARSILVAPLSDITRRFDRVRYGNAACAHDDWQQFERDVAALEASTAS